MYAPLQSDGTTPMTYWKYIFEGRTYYIPNYGFQPAISDFDFANVRQNLPIMLSPKFGNIVHTFCPL